MKASIGIIMGSHTDWEIMQHTELTLGFLGIPNEIRVLSAERSPDLVADYGKNAKDKGLSIIIAAAGASPHLPALVAAYTLLPVLGVPLSNTALNGIDSVLFALQMPSGLGVGTFSLGREGAINSALFAAQILGLTNPKIADAISEFRQGQAKKILDYPDPRNSP